MEEDGDVVAEAARVAAGGAAGDVIVMRSLRKVYASGGGGKVRQTPCRPRSWPNSSLCQPYSRRNDWASSQPLGRPEA